MKAWFSKESNSSQDASKAGCRKDTKTMIRCILISIAIPVCALAAEVEIALAPKIQFSDQKVTVAEESINFFGTAIHILKSDLLAQRVAAHYGGKPPLVAIEVTQLPHTSVFRISAKGSNLPEEQRYLDYLVQEYNNFRTEQFAESYVRAIAQLEDAIKSTKDEPLRKRLEELLLETRVSKLADQELVFKKIK